jgi:hypothetical protein
VLLEQLWRHLPTDRHKAISTTLAQMIAKQIAATAQDSLPEKEESDE